MRPRNTKMLVPQGQPSTVKRWESGVPQRPFPLTAQWQGIPAVVSVGSQPITCTFSPSPVSLVHILTFVSWDHFPEILHCTQALSQDTLLRKFQLRCLGKPSQQDWRMRKARCLPSFQRLPQLSSRHPCSTCCSPSERGVVPWTCWHFPPSVTRAVFSAWSTLPFVFLISGVQITPEFKTQRKYCFPSVSADPTHPYSYILGWETNPSFL